MWSMPPSFLVVSRVGQVTELWRAWVASTMFQCHVLAGLLYYNCAVSSRDGMTRWDWCPINDTRVLYQIWTHPCHHWWRPFCTNPHRMSIGGLRTSVAQAFCAALPAACFFPPANLSQNRKNGMAPTPCWCFARGHSQTGEPENALGGR